MNDGHLGDSNDPFDNFIRHIERDMGGLGGLGGLGRGLGGFDGFGNNFMRDHTGSNLEGFHDQRLNGQDRFGN